MGKKCLDTLAINPTHGTRLSNWKGTPNTQFLPEEEIFWTPHLISQISRPLPKEQTPKTPSTENKRAVHPQDPQNDS